MRIKEVRVDPSHEMTEPIPYMNGKTGEVIGRVLNNVIARVSRKKLRRFLTEGEDLHVKVCRQISIRMCILVNTFLSVAKFYDRWRCRTTPSLLTSRTAAVRKAA